MMFKIKKLDEKAILPKREGLDAGLDLFSLEKVSIYPGQTVMIRTGVSIQAPEPRPGYTYVGLIKDRSSFAMNGIHTLGGVIDLCTYTGEIKVLVTNLNKQVTTSSYRRFGREWQDPRLTTELVAPFLINYHQKFCQMVVLEVPIMEFEVVEELEETERGEGGFGSTGEN